MKVDDYLEECEKWQNIKYLTTKEKFLQGTQQADTIEELIEQVVVIKENGKPRVWSAKKTFNGIKNNGYKYLLNLIKREKQQLYGAIWTDRGLIYVAKMNEDGKLVLI